MAIPTVVCEITGVRLFYLDITLDVLMYRLSTDHEDSPPPASSPLTALPVAPAFPTMGRQLSGGQRMHDLLGIISREV